MRLDRYGRNLPSLGLAKIWSNEGRCECYDIVEIQLLNRKLRIHFEKSI